MKIFSDFHHSGLFYSFHLLFEKRLGWEIYRPIGLEWFPDWWDIAKPYGQNESTAKQYLEIRDSDPFYTPKDGSPILNSISDRNPDYYVIDEISHGYKQKAITFQQFLDMDIDIIIASIPDHWVTYTKLRDTYKPKAKVICQMGNIFWENEGIIKNGVVKNLMASTKSFQVPSGMNAVFYHQEQPLISYYPPPLGKNISSYVHLLPKKEQYDEYKNQLSGFNMRSYGSGCPDGLIATLPDIYDRMKCDDFIYHVKPHGDGYGWVWHSAFMLGRPVLTNFSDYKDKLGGDLFEDGVTGIDLERHTVKENCDIIRSMYDENKVNTMCFEAKRRFDNVVNYDVEEKSIIDFIGKLS